MERTKRMKVDGSWAIVKPNHSLGLWLCIRNLARSSAMALSMILSANAVADDVEWLYNTDILGGTEFAWISVKKVGKPDSYGDIRSSVPNGTVTIPSSIDGLPVRGIDRSAFSYCTNLTAVVMPDSIMYMRLCAFQHCHKLESVVFSANLTSISDGAFEQCNLKSINIPSRVSSIGRDAFYGCTSLTNVTIPASVKTINLNAFVNCTNLVAVNINSLSAWCTMKLAPTFESDYVHANPLAYAKELYLNGELVEDVNIPTGIGNIGRGVFYNYAGLKSVTIPSDVTKIGSGAFEGCSGLTNVTIAASGGYNLNIDDYAFQNCIGLKCITIPERATNVGRSAFYQCAGLEDITLSGSITNIGVYAFMYCTSLKSVTIPDGVVSIGEQAFYGCSEMTNAIVSGTVKSIGRYAFRFSPKLEKLFLPTTYTNSTYKIANDTCQIVRYEPDQTITFDLVGGEMVQQTCTVRYGAQYGELPTPTRAGYTFDGWWLDGAEISASSIVSALDDHVLVAHWRPNRCMVAFDANGGTGEMGSIEVEYDSVTNLPYNVFRYPKMVFDGWATNATGEVIYADGASISNVCTEAGAVQTLFAVWSPLVVAAPVMTPGDGFVFRTDSCDVTLSCATEGATIYYSTNGTTPRTSAANAYNGPFAVSGAVTVIAVAVCDGVKSGYMTASLVKGAPLVPVITPYDGHLFVGDSCEVTITCPTATATIYYTVDGSAPQRSETCRYTGPFSINKTTTVKAFAANDTLDSESVTATITKWTLTLAEAVGAPALVFSTGGDAEWTPIADATATSGYSAKSGAIGDAESGAESVTWLETSVSGSGSFSFRWKVSCEHDDFGDCTWDRLTAFTNGVEVARIDGESGWRSVNLRFDDVGAHTIRWAFIKDDFNEEQFPDIAWVSGVVWSPDSGIDVDPIPEISSDSEIASALAGSADEVRLKTIITNKAEYDAYRAWVEAHSLNHQTVKNSSHTWASYVLGTSVLLENEPTVEFSEAYMSNDSGGGSVVVNGRMMVEVVVKDGARAVNVDATKVASMFEATSDLVDWTDAAKVELSVTPVDGTGEGVHFLVAPVDVSAERVFMRIKK